MGFTRRFNQFPSIDVLREIEGVVTIDQVESGDISGVSQGVACVVGEFADVTFGVAIDATGGITTNPQPVEVFDGQSNAVLGGWDETIGEFGGSGGSGFLEIKNRSFARLVAVPINLASSQGARLWRKLPTNAGATNATPVVPVSGATVPAGREFRSGSNRVRLAQRVQFSATPEYKTGTDGSVTAAGAPAATQVFTTPAGGLSSVARPDGTAGAQIGDAIVIGVIGGSAGLGANADTYRVVSVDSDTQVHVERMSGSTFDWTTASALPWRLHVSDTADTGGAHAIAAQAGYRVPMRPLDATIAVATTMAPTIIPAALTAQGADPLSSLAARTDPSVGLIYTAAVQAPNSPVTPELDALYAIAIDALIDDDLPEREVNIVWCARSSALNDAKLTSHVLNQKQNGAGRIALVAPPLTVQALATAVGDAAPGVGAHRARERVYVWPGLTTFVGEAVGTPVKGADGLTHKDGILDTPSTGWAGSVMSKLAPERNPGQASDPVQTIMSLALGIQRGVVGLGIGQYIQMKAKGVMGPRKDRKTGVIFQSGVTSSLLPGEAEIYTRRFSFYVEDSVADFLAAFSKEPLTEALKDKIVGGIHDLFDGWLSAQNPAAARIRGFLVDSKSSNTKQLSDAGIFVVDYKIEMIPIANTIAQRASVGFGVLSIQQLQG
jgi:hypothetical protein